MSIKESKFGHREDIFADTLRLLDQNSDFSWLQDERDETPENTTLTEAQSQEIGGIFRVDEGDCVDGARYVLEVNGATFGVDVISKENGFRKYIQINFLSVLDKLVPYQVYGAVAAMLNAAYPRSCLTPEANLIDHHGREERYRLSDHFHGVLHDSAMTCVDLHAAVYQFPTPNRPNIAPVATNLEEPLLIHGFVNQQERLCEFVRMEHQKAHQYVDGRLATLFLERNRAYIGRCGNTADAAHFIRSLKYICEQNPQRNIFSSNV